MQCKCFWPIEFAELADGPVGRGNVARGGCLFAWNVSATERTIALNMTLRK